MTPFDRYTRDTVMPAIYRLMRGSLDEHPDEPYTEERAREEGRAMCNSAQQLYEHALIDAGAAGQSFARILAAVFRGEPVPAELIAQARDEFAEHVLDYLMKGGK